MGKQGTKRPPPKEGALDEVWICACGFKNRADNTVCGGKFGNKGCKAPCTVEGMGQVRRKTVMCKYATAGQTSRCKAGRTCTFAHSLEELYVPPPGTKKTKMCMHVMFSDPGNCKHGQFCHFAHSEEELGTEVRVWT